MENFKNRTSITDTFLNDINDGNNDHIILTTFDTSTSHKFPYDAWKRFFDELISDMTKRTSRRMFPTKKDTFLNDINDGRYNYRDYETESNSKLADELTQNINRKILESICGYPIVEPHIDEERFKALFK